ncbi:hypothetical protein CHELA41_21735 [Hyphomicrobiales bacterium]|nr:hypothetical protein CHELA41_21735 [Hyphomicrobiales bacterium]
MHFAPNTLTRVPHLASLRAWMSLTPHVVIIGSRVIRETFQDRQSRQHRVVLLRVLGELRKYDLMTASGAGKAYVSRARVVARKRAGLQVG